MQKQDAIKKLLDAYKRARATGKGLQYGQAKMLAGKLEEYLFGEYARVSYMSSGTRKQRDLCFDPEGDAMLYVNKNNGSRDAQIWLLYRSNNDREPISNNPRPYTKFLEHILRIEILREQDYLESKRLQGLPNDL